MSKVRVPNPYEKSTDSYFENTPDAGIRCVAAAISFDSDTHAVICCPDIVVLKKVWDQIATSPLDVKKSVVVLYKYDTELVRLQRDQLEEMKVELKPKVSELKKESDPESWYWYYYPHSKRAECFIEESSFVPDRREIKLGDAIKCSEEECKRLLRENKIPRSLLEGIKINTSVDTLIPF